LIARQRVPHDTFTGKKGAERDLSSFSEALKDGIGGIQDDLNKKKLGQPNGQPSDKKRELFK
jgi:hypothetical protein